MFAIVFDVHETTSAEIVELLDTVRDVCHRLDPAGVPLADAAAVFDALVMAERLIEGARLRVTARYEQSGAWRRNGAKHPEHDLAARTRTSRTAARRTLTTSRRLTTRPATDTAVRTGTASAGQADDICDATDTAPDAETDLLAAAHTDTRAQLRRRAAHAKQSADTDRAATRRRLHTQRCVRRWDDPDGMANLLLRLHGEDMTRVDTALRTDLERARRTTPPDDATPAAAHLADLLRARLLDRTPQPAATATPARADKKVIALIDVTALNRGTTHPGETCEIAGVGPVSVAAIQRLIGDATLTLVLRNGVDVRNVTHLGRSVTAHQRTALEARGACCEFCGSRHRVEIDHITGWALTHTTRLDDLSLKCWDCHDRKTRLHLREAGPPGNRHFLDPDGSPHQRTEHARPPTEHTPDPPRARNGDGHLRAHPQPDLFAATSADP